MERRCRFFGRVGLAWLVATGSWDLVHAEAQRSQLGRGGDANDLTQLVCLEVVPARFHLDGKRRRVRFLVTGTFADGTVRDLSRLADVTSLDPSTVAVRDGIALPVADGQTTVRVCAGDQTCDVPITVSGQSEPDPAGFINGALVALSKQGCNAGACHGSPSGKGGFRLSLRAYDSALDAFTLLREEFHRRVDVVNPDESLLLKKPLTRVSHGGGQRLREGDEAYALLRSWIAEGALLDPADAPFCVGIEVHPPRRILHAPACQQQILTLGHFSDGSVRDLTDVAIYTSSDDALAGVDEHGLVSGEDKGEVAIQVRYLEHVETARITFLRDVPGFAWKDPPENNYVDRHVFAKLRQLQILPSELCTDDEFLRRVHLDVLGILPGLEETEAFLRSLESGKRATLIDALLERPEYADYWALKWSDLLRLNGKKVGRQAVPKFYAWIRDAIRDNVPYDQFVAELLTAQGSTYSNPAANYFRAAADTNDCAETTAQLFLGIRIQCAKCHNHPFERWTQDNYYGIGAFFNRVQRKPLGGGDEVLVWVSRDGEVTQPRTGRQVDPWLPLTGTARTEGDQDRREALARWMAEGKNPFFAQAEVNRIWGHLFGRGIVEPTDDFRASNPPANEELLQALAADFVASGFDRKHIIRTILNSRTYQLSFQPNDFNANDEKYFSHARPRLLTAEQMLDAVCHVTGVPEDFPGLPPATRATQLPSPVEDNQFLKVFGQPARETACQCERSRDSNLSQALQMINGPVIHRMLKAENNHLRRWVAEGASDVEIADRLFLLALCRLPQEDERALAVAHVAGSADRLAGLEDLCWGILNMKEFMFQH